jgi:hypothetical protein
MQRIFVAGCVLAALTSCSFDTALPDAPLRGRIKGTLDTQGHLPPGGPPVLLSSDEGAYVGSCERFDIIELE